jgi:hypothetical protein
MTVAPPVLIAMSGTIAALLPPRVRKECEDLAGDLTRVKAFVAKFASLGYFDAAPSPPSAKDVHADCTFICSDLVSFLCRVEKLCSSREAALYVRRIARA